MLPTFQTATRNKLQRAPLCLQMRCFTKHGSLTIRSIRLRWMCAFKLDV